MNTTTTSKRSLAGPVLSVTSLFWAMFLAQTASSLIGILIALHVNEMKMSAMLIGAIMSSFFVGYLLGAVYSSRLIARIGHIRVFAAAATLVSASYILFPLTDQWWAWALFRIFAGLGTAFMATAVESWLNDSTPSSVRGSVLGLYVVITAVAQLIGQLLVNLWPNAVSDPYLIASILLSLSLLPVALTRMPAPEITNVEPLSLKALYQLSPSAIIGCFGSGLLLSISGSYAVIYAKRLDFTTIEASLFAAVMIAGGSLFMFPIGAIADRLDRRVVLIVNLFIAALISLLIGLLGVLGINSFSMLMVLGLFLGAMIYSVYPIAQTQAFDYIPKSKFTAAASGLIIVYALGSILGPLLGALLLDISVVFLFVLLSMIAFALAVFVLYRTRKRSALPLSEQISVVPTPHQGFALTAVSIATKIASKSARNDVAQAADEAQEDQADDAPQQEQAPRDQTNSDATEEGDKSQPRG